MGASKQVAIMALNQSTSDEFHLPENLIESNDLMSYVKKKKKSKQLVKQQLKVQQSNS